MPLRIWWVYLGAASGQMQCRQAKELADMKSLNQELDSVELGVALR